MNERENVIFGKVLTLLKQEYQPEFDKQGFGKVGLHFCNEALRTLVSELDRGDVIPTNTEAVRHFFNDSSERL